MGVNPLGSLFFRQIIKISFVVLTHCWEGKVAYTKHCKILLNTCLQSWELWCLKQFVAENYYPFLFPEYLCSYLISYQKFLQIAAISTHWPLSFPVARFRLCYLIGKHLNSTAGGGREKLKCGTRFELVYWNHYCDMSISTNFSAWQFSFSHVCTVTHGNASCPEISCVHFEAIGNTAMNLMSSLFRSDESRGAGKKIRTVAWIWPLGHLPHIESKHTSGGFKLLKLEPAVFYIRQMLIYNKSNILLFTVWGFVAILKTDANINSKLTAKHHVCHNNYFIVGIEIIINYMSFERNIWFFLFPLAFRLP